MTKFIIICLLLIFARVAVPPTLRFLSDLLSGKK